ncbi:antA/AntB antirepressor family protein [Spirosoma oryzicola]|uniref:antA/AntB antirepressor family protein n=1 Tax=Spirosoma oryzicola TaxID=2898794 RepID=UPI001E414978|nr:antA/AntB antirepressor family protein [Spirosoma oryzicola]UHG89810.1 antA/AntB antirepressor family protein [Spirosoma oryzicola]
MKELIAITTSGQGSLVVSARELHEFLGVKSRFIDWIKNRVGKYKFLEDTDYVTVSKNLETGGRELDYALTSSLRRLTSHVRTNG